MGSLKFSHQMRLIQSEGVMVQLSAQLYSGVSLTM
jgi:hypothetical protein